MLKNIFNKAVQCAEDTAYGWVLPGMNEKTRLRTTLYGSAGVALGAIGLMTQDGSAMIIGTGVVASAAFAFQQRGAEIRRAWEAQPR